jgi:hypothetical protein
MSIQLSSRIVYRKLFRELARQYVEAAEVHNVQDRKRQEALRRYRQNKDDASTASMKTTVSDYDSKSLRDIFQDKTGSENNLEFGYQVAEYLKSQRIYKTLLQRYNPGALMEDEERIRLSAKRVGLDLPNTVEHV